MKALIVIDMLNDFVDEKGSLFVPDAKKIVGKINREIEKARKNRDLVIFVCDSHQENDDEFRIWPKHCVEGTKGAEIYKELDFRNDVFVKKTRYSAFYKTNLDEILKENNINTLILTGTATDICVLHTAADAFMRGYRIIVPKKAVATLSEERQEWALNHMRDVLKAEVV